MKKLLPYMKGFEKECVLGPFFKLLEATFELMIPIVVRRIVDVGIANGDSGYVVRMCCLMIFLGIVGLICAIAAQFFAAKASVGFAARLRHSVMEHLLSFSYSQLDDIGTSTMITRMTSDINQVQNGVNLTLRLLLRSPFVVFGAMIMAFTIDFQAAAVFAGVIPLLCIIVFGIMLITMPMYKKVQSALDGVTASTRQNLSGVRVLRAFNMEQAEVNAFREKNDDLTDRQLSSGRISNLMNPITFVVINLAVILLMRIGALKVSTGVLSQGYVIALYNYMSQILVELIKMANLIISMTKAAACANRVESILSVQSEEKTGKNCNSISGAVSFSDVSARYDGSNQDALEHISFSASPGQTIGIIGGTGSGKTTLVNLIPGFYTASNGQVLIDGCNVTEFDLTRLRQQIGIVPQKSVLFKGTIRENLLWGNQNAEDGLLWQALSIAQAREIVEGKEGGLDAPVEQGGTNFSGGQRQRLAIARALVRQPAILILDDSASALDFATDAALRKAIRSMPNPPTTFIVSQRASSVRYADEILVLDDGVLAGKGTHQQLLEQCDVYREIFYSQFSEEAAQNEK